MENLTREQKMQHMIDLQTEFDKRVLNSKEYPRDQMKLALLAEIGEYLAEVPSQYKHWKKDPQDNLENAKAEIIDIFHFVLSLQINYWETTTNSFKFEYETLCKSCLAELSYYDKFYQNHAFVLVNLIDDTFGMIAFKELMVYNNVTFDELYDGYLAKNKINHERQDNNY